MKTVKYLAFLLSSAALCGTLYAQGMLEPHPYMREGVVDHHGTVATVRTDYAQPLCQAVIAIRQEYGWAVHYEAPPYQGKHDLMDTTNPSYRAAHPGAKVDLGPAGGAFQSTYPESPSVWHSPDMGQQVLEKVVSDYNQSGNPGHFAVRRLCDGSFDVIGDAIHDDAGANIPIRPVFDTPINLARVARSRYDAVQAVLDALSSKVGIKMYIYEGAYNVLSRESTVIGAIAPARDLLMQALDGSRLKWVWILTYHPQQQTEPAEYCLGIFPVVRAEYDTSGRKHLTPVDPLHITGGPR
jgi:hypothetical protein